jgi:hypothetical protein
MPATQCVRTLSTSTCNGIQVNMTHTLLSTRVSIITISISIAATAIVIAVVIVIFVSHFHVARVAVCSCSALVSLTSKKLSRRSY